MPDFTILSLHIAEKKVSLIIEVAKADIRKMESVFNLFPILISAVFPFCLNGKNVYFCRLEVLIRKYLKWRLKQRAYHWRIFLKRWVREWA
mgnify:CR=1 FL=1